MMAQANNPSPEGGGHVQDQSWTQSKIQFLKTPDHARQQLLRESDGVPINTQFSGATRETLFAVA